MHNKERRRVVYVCVNVALINIDNENSICTLSDIEELDLSIVSQFMAFFLAIFYGLDLHPDMSWVDMMLGWRNG